MGSDEKNQFKKSYFDVLNLCCSSEVPLIEKILTPLDGVKDVSVVVTSRTVIVVHDNRIISQQQIVKVLNQARLEANVRVYGVGNEVQFENRWPSPYAIASGLFLLLSFLKYVYGPLQWLALGAVVIGIGPIFLKAVSAIRNFTIDINILAVMAVIGSVSLRDYWEAGTIVFLYSIAQWLEARASHKATAVMSSLVNVVPQKAVIAETGQEVDVREVGLNTILAVKAGEVIPIDGIVVDGKCEVDQKTLTGEPFLASKEVGSTVWAGTINLNGYVSVKTTALAEDCVVAKMATIVEEAQNSKSKTQRLIDKCAKYYTPVIVVISACLAAIPAILGVHNQNEWFHKSLVVLISACPCALIISTPVATFCALSKAATSGLLIRGGEYIETLSNIKIMAFDKTGTITKGEFAVSDFRSLTLDVSLNTLLYWVSSIESKSSHPMATALVDYGRLHSIEPNPEEVEEFENFPGEGIQGKINGKNIFVGNEKIALRAGCKKVPVLAGVATEGKSIGYIFLGATQAGCFSLTDDCRTGVKEAIDQLKSMGIKVAMLTGDNKESAKFLQNKLEDALDVVRAELLPQDKAKIIKDFQKEAPTAMVGDGLNDTPALATADIGISMGISGSALANETSHVILMSNDIRKIPEMVRLARKTHRKIVENITLSILPKVAIVALAFAGHPLVWAAVLFDVGTCVTVILSSMLLLKANLKHKIEEQSQRRTKEYDGQNSSSSPLYDSLLPAPTMLASQGCCSQNSSSKCNKSPQKSSCCPQKTKDTEEKSCAEKQKHLQEASNSNHESFNASESKKCCSGLAPNYAERCNKSIQSHPGSTSHISKGMTDSSCFPADEEQGYVDETCCLALNDNDSSKCRRHVVDYLSLGDSEEFVLLGSHSKQKRTSGGCCKSYRKECCVKNGYALSEIIIE